MAKKKLVKKSKKIPVINNDDHLGKAVLVKCTGTELININDLTNFQGKLKSLSDEAYGKLKASILDLGFSFPVFAWKYRNKNFILDAHQRVHTLKKMREEGYFIPQLPVVWIEAKDRFEAAKKLLASTSQYGDVTPDGLHEFMTEFGLKMADLTELFKFPEIDFESFALTFFPEMKLVEFQALEKKQENKKEISIYAIEVEFPNNTEMMDVHDDLCNRGFIVRIK